MKTKIGIALGIIAVFLVGLVIVVVRLEQRREFREKMRPLVEEDLSDFASDQYSSGSLMVGLAIEKREKRIAEVGLFSTSRYRVARDSFANLMEAENSFLGDREAFSEAPTKVEGDKTQIQLQTMEMNVLENPLLSSSRGIAEICGAAKELLRLTDTTIADMKAMAFEAKLAEGSRMKGIEAWDSAYGWIKWLGLEVPPDNPFRSVPTFEPTNEPKVLSSWKKVEEQAGDLRRFMATGPCKDIR